MGAFRFFKNQFPRYDERFLIGKRQVFTRFESRKSREQSGTSNHSGNNQVGFRKRSDRNRALLAGNDFHIQIANKLFQRIHFAGVKQSRQCGFEFSNLAGKQVHIASGGQGANLKTFRITLYNIQRIDTDRTR